ncbi:SseB family protein [Streptosporangium pseudovulgare]|uniref:SseB family protein n=1 Tax=Streptosporangium pseudovulgare TaxID=35765 RepID=UPI0016705756|nr:SseB family protein [Streptosporangium pseudovulgare]
MQEWRPESPFEKRLQAAFAAEDLPVCLALLRQAEIGLPVTPAAAEGREPAAWPTFTGDGRTWMAAYTSLDAMRAVLGDITEHVRIVTFAELAAGWPDPRWGLAVNPGLSTSFFFLEAGTVARLAVPSLVEERLAEPGSGPPIMQKLLRPADLYAHLAEGGSRVSGYCHRARDVAHIATPTVLADALGQAHEEGVVTDEGSVNILRWRAVGLDLYRTPYGGVDEASRAAVAGWVIEEPPFVGMGLVPNADQLIREYKVDGVGLPHGAEIWELTVDGVEYRRAVYDGDLGRWFLVDDVPAGEAPDGADASGGPAIAWGPGAAGGAGAADDQVFDGPFHRGADAPGGAA